MARISVSIGFLERPLTLGLLAGWLTGRWDVALPLAVLMELFWLDAIRMGVVVPPMASLAYLLLLPVAPSLAPHIPEQLPLPLLLCLALGHAGAWLERRERQRADALAEAVETWNAGGKGGITPERAVAFSLAAQAVSRFVLYLLCYACVYAVVVVGGAWGALPSVPALTWNALYGLGLMGAVLSLRTRRAYAVLVCGLAAAILVHM